jgi:hypothetical protein
MLRWARSRCSRGTGPAAPRARRSRRPLWKRGSFPDSAVISRGSPSAAGRDIGEHGLAHLESWGHELPTGRLADVAGTALDLRHAVAVGTLDLDHVFTRVEPGRHAAVEYRGTGLRIGLEANGDFSHLVLYTPQGEGFFCFENQTCSTDAHNLFARGFTDVSGLKTLEPGAVRRGSVSYAVSASSAPTVPKSRPDARLSRIPGIMTGPRLLGALPGTRGTPSRRARRPRPPA